MAAPSVSCELSLKSGESTTFKYDLTTNDGKFSHQSLRGAISTMQGDVNTFLTAQVEKEKQENALKNGGARLHQRQRQSKSGSAEDSGGGDSGNGDGEGDDLTGDSAADSGSDDADLEEDDNEEEEQDSSNKADSNDNQTGKREAKDWDSTSSKKSKFSDS